ncbi:hypothetical protein AZI86_11315 [Bdellovibrio bacteriovorus]|uniref:Uncharacterized protein n=1 Tax=Bdellovibrio bacteriovorus TaxID=959 RepID=A0A150WLK3_BDEBC|nr:hypothetical protein [Bdellovibrio bacteriovorus]KYG64786.1 hypothetical protein AZI86_11315 [Bdellovibrio bacteriovorus]
MAVKMNVKTSGNCTMMSIEGSLIEPDSEFEGLNINPTYDLIVDLEGLKLINSMGVRHFHAWSSGLQAREVIFENCPPIFIYQLNLVPHFLPSKSHIESFLVPYYSDGTKEEKLVLFKKDVHYKKVGGKVVLEKPEVLDSKGDAMQPDIMTERYFNFLNDYF